MQLIFSIRGPQPAVNLQPALRVNFVIKNFPLLSTTIGICRSENIKNRGRGGGVNFTFEIYQGINERIKIENPCFRYFASVDNILRLLRENFNKFDFIIAKKILNKKRFTFSGTPDIK